MVLTIAAKLPFHGFIDQAKHPCKSMAEFCAGYSKGYEDEADFYAQ
jgi:hypothetical protein